MRTHFADTVYWIALLDRDDELNVQAVALSHATKRDRIVTSELVFVEVLNHFAKFGRQIRQSAVKFVLDLRAEPRITIVALDAQQFENALDLYHRRSDKTWSLVDCASFLIMRERQVTAALTHDRHFAQAGFTALLRTS